MVLNLNWLGVSGGAGLCCVFRTEAPVESHAATLARTSSNTPDPCTFCLNQVLAVAHAETPRGAQFFTIPICSYVEPSGVTSHSLGSWELGKRSGSLDSALQTGPASAEVEVGGDIKDLLEQEAWETAEGRGPRLEYCGLIRVEVQVFILR